MISFLNNSRHEAEFEEIILDLIRKTKERYGEKLVIDDDSKTLIGKGVFKEKDCMIPAWKNYLQSWTFREDFQTILNRYDNRNDSKT